MIGINTNYRSLPEQVDYLTDENENNKTDISNLENDVENLDGRVTQNEDDIDNIEDDIEDLQEDVAQNTEDIGNLSSEVEAISGRGGYLIPHNFETATPTENQLNAYALSQIPNITQPEEIFNGTRVTNLYNNHTWILNNTQDTDPVVFEWVDLGQSLVSIATENTLGVVKGSPSDFNVTVNNDGTMSVNGIANALNGKQDKLTTTSVEDGTINKAIGFDSLGNIVKGSAGGGSQLYLHNIAFSYSGNTNITHNISIITHSPTPITFNDFKNYLINNGYDVNNKFIAPYIASANASTSYTELGMGFYVSSSNTLMKIQQRVKLNVDFAAQTASFAIQASAVPQQESDFTNYFRTDNVTPL